MNDAVDQILMGAAGDGSGGLLTTMILAVGARIARRFQTEPVIQALKQALETSLIAAFDTLPDKTNSLNNYYMQCMADFLRQKIVAQELSVLLSPDENFDMVMLREQFIVVSQGYSPDQIPGLDFEGFIKTLSRSFYEAVKQSPNLQGVIVVERLDQLVLLIENSTELSERSVVANESTADATAKILDLLSNRLHQKKPELSVGFLNDDGNVVDKLVIQLDPRPREPDYNQIISNKRKALLDRAKVALTPVSAVKILVSSSDYPKKVETFLEKYRKYLEEMYSYPILKDRFRKISPVVFNNGKATAHKILLQFRMPRDIRPIDEDDERIIYILYEGEQMKPSPPHEPDMFVDLAAHMSGSSSWIIPSVPYINDVSSIVQNIGGPFFEQNDDDATVSYEIEELVLRRKEILEPFFLNFIALEKSSIWNISVTIDAEEFDKELLQTLEIEVIINDDTGGES